ncbi:MAG: flagellar biosynthetic protein FliR [Halanaerobiales bacterium]
MSLGDILSNYTYVFLLILVRFSGLFLITPMLSSRLVPARVKIGLAFLFTIVSFPVIDGSHLMPSHEIMILMEVLRELLVGLVIGFIVYLVFAIFQLAGRFVDMRMGFAIVNVTDPIHGSTVPLMGQYKNILITLLFLVINGHHIMIRAISRSFEMIPLGGAVLTNAGFELIIKNIGELFLIAFMVALPVIATLFIVDIILGFLARTIPQLNIFVVGLPLKILVGLIMMTLALNIIIEFSGQLFHDMFQEVYKLLQLLIER